MTPSRVFPLIASSYDSTIAVNRAAVGSCGDSFPMALPIPSKSRTIEIPSAEEQATGSRRADAGSFALVGNGRILLDHLGGGALSLRWKVSIAYIVRDIRPVSRMPRSHTSRDDPGHLRQSVLIGPGHGLEPAVHVELAKDVLNVIADRSWAHPQPIGEDFRIGARSHEPQDLQLPPAEAAHPVAVGGVGRVEPR